MNPHMQHIVNATMVRRVQGMYNPGDDEMVHNRKKAGSATGKDE